MFRLALLIYVFSTVIALPSFADWTLTITVVSNDYNSVNVTGDGDYGSGWCYPSGQVHNCGQWNPWCNSPCTFYEHLYPGYESDTVTLWPFGSFFDYVDSTGKNYDIAVSWTGCPSTDRFNNCVIPITNTSTMNITANFQRVYGSPSHVNVTLSGTGKGYVSSKANIIRCGDGYANCSGTVYSGAYQVYLDQFPDNFNAFSDWIGCSSVLPTGSGYGTPRCLINVGQDANVTAVFTKKYLVTPVPGANGKVSPSTPQGVLPNGTTSFTFTPDTGYYLASATGCGGSLSGNTYTTGPITQDCSVYAGFGPFYYMVTPSAGPNGSIDPDTPQWVGYNGTMSFFITPDWGYVAVATGCGGTLSGITYTTGPITKECTISATFVHPYIVTPSAGANGTISPNSPQAVVPNGVTSFTVTPNNGYDISSATGCGGSLSGNTYTTGPVTSDCTVTVNFAVRPPVSVPALSMPAVILLAAVLGGIVLRVRKKNLRVRKKNQKSKQII